MREYTMTIQNPAFVPSNYQVFLATTLLMIIHGTISSMPTRWIATFNSYGSSFNMIALIVAIILIPVSVETDTQTGAKFNESSYVWSTVYKGTDFPDGIAILMSWVAVIWTLSGYDAPFHLSEECSNANVASPRAIVMTSSIGGSLGWFLSLVVAYTVKDIDEIISSDLGQPFAAYCVQVLPRKVALAILSLTIISGFSMGQGCMVSASRVTFAYGRDGVFPFSRIWAKVNRITQTPVNAVIGNTTIGILMLLLIFGGPLAVGALFSIGALAQYTAFTIPIFIRIFFVGNRFRPGPWNLGRFSLPVGCVACGFVLLMLPILCFPSSTGPDLNAQGMNWTCVVYGGPMLLAMVWWYAGARKWFKGPKINLEHVMLERDEQVNQVEAEESNNERVDSSPSRLTSEKIR